MIKYSESKQCCGIAYQFVKGASLVEIKRACPEAARLFLSSAAEGRPFAFTVTESNVGYKVNTTNDDKEFLDYLLKAR